MASHYYGYTLGAGADPAGVSIGTSTTSKKVELVVEDALAGMTGNKVVLLQAIEAIKAYVEKNDAPA